MFVVFGSGWILLRRRKQKKKRRGMQKVVDVFCFFLWKGFESINWKKVGGQKIFKDKMASFIFLDF